MNEPSPMTAEPRCEECGFSLTGHIRSGAPPRCSECGAVFNLDRLWTPEALPNVQTIAWRLCAPVMVVIVLFVAASFTKIGRDLLVWPFLLIWASTFGGIGLVWPIGWTYGTVNSQVPRRDRKAMAWRWLGPVLLINAVATSAAILLFIVSL